MPAPGTTEEYLELLAKSGLLQSQQIHDYLQKLLVGGSLPGKPGEMAGLLVRDGLLTQFQADQLVRGKWRGFCLGKFRILDRVGSGGMASVYLCEHRVLHRRVAIKILPASKASSPSALERFYREARAVAALDHPNIVRAYDIDQENGMHFLVMEFIDGSSLQALVKTHGPLAPVQAANYIRQAALGLQHAFETAGLVHRDIKPGNVLVEHTGVVKILDMGLARFFYDDDDVISKKYDETVLGTADYLAPEQTLLNRVDIRADIYSLGATFYFLLTGSTPFGKGTKAQKLIWHQVRQPKPVRGLRPDVPEVLAAIVTKMMAKDPSERYQTPAEVVQVLTPWALEANAAAASRQPVGLSPAAT